MYRNIISVLLVVIALSGCIKDPNLVSPTNSHSTNNYPSTLNDLNSVLVPCYSNLRDDNLFGRSFLTKAMADLTHTANASYDGDQSWNQMAKEDLTISNLYVDKAWKGFYDGIKNCNVLLSAADFYSKNYSKPEDIQTINSIRGQAYFLRAFYYFELESLFGEDWVPNPMPGDTLGVPIFNKLPLNLSATQQPRSSIKAVWAQIEDDLQKAATLLKGKVWTGNDIGRVTEWSAKSLLGKAYVFTKDWNKAKASLLDVINNSGKSLMTYDKYRNSFIGISADEFNEESLFEINIDQDSKGGYAMFGSTPNSTTLNGIIWSPWALGYNGTEADSKTLGYGNENLHDKNILRFGFNIGTYNLVNNSNYDPDYDPATQGYISYSWPKDIMDPAYKQKSLQVRINKTCDPRLFVNALQPWVDSVIYDPKAGWMYVSKPNYEANNPDSYGWSIRKYAPIFNSIFNTGPADAANIYFLRLADVYLLYAEACMNTGDKVDALEFLNKVKRRAYSYPVNSPSPIDYKSLSDQTSAINDPVLGHNPLYYERWAELFNEGQWWFDICRWHIGPSEAAYYGTALNINGKINWDDKMYAWPIPLSEINSNSKVKGQQNPGYH